jgi:hypothetical protein
VFEGLPLDPGSVGKGVGIVLGCVVGAVFVGIMLATLLPAALVLLLGIGVVQAAWIVPIWRYYRNMGETETVKGLLIAASVVFLLNASCWGTVAGWR